MPKWVKWSMALPGVPGSFPSVSKIEEDAVCLLTDEEAKLALFAPKDGKALAVAVPKDLTHDAADRPLHPWQIKGTQAWQEKIERDKEAASAALLSSAAPVKPEAPKKAKE